MKSSTFLLWCLCVVTMGAGLSACSQPIDTDEQIIWALIAERDSLQQEIDGLQDENIYLYEELADCGKEF